MGIFERIFAKRSAEVGTETRTQEKAAPCRVGVDEYGAKALALKVSAVYRCVDLLSKSVASVPIVVKEDKGGYFAKSDYGLGLSRLLSSSPNGRMSAFEMVRSLMAQVLLTGNSYIVPEMDYDGYVSLKLCMPGSVNYNAESDIYIITDTRNRIFGTYQPEDVLHFKNLGVDGGYTGRSVLDYAARTVALSTNADMTTVTNYQRGGTAKGFISGKDAGATWSGVKDTQIDEVAQGIQEKLDGGVDIFGVPPEMTFSQISISPKDLELLGTKQFGVLEICRFFGVPPQKAFAEQSSNYKASETAGQEFVTDSLRPYMEMIRQEMERKLLPGVNDVYSISFDTDVLCMSDPCVRAEYAAKTIAAGLFTVNEWRAREGMPPVAGGDEPMVSANLLPLQSAISRQNGGDAL